MEYISVPLLLLNVPRLTAQYFEPRIPYAGTELETANERQKQATQKLPYGVQCEFDARRKLAACGCDATPLLHSYKREEQGIDGMVSGGWTIYMLIQQAPGAPLGGVDDTFKTFFWGSPYSVRNDIRKAFGLPGSMSLPN